MKIINNTNTVENASYLDKAPKYKRQNASAKENLSKSGQKDEPLAQEERGTVSSIRANKRASSKDNPSAEEKRINKMSSDLEGIKRMEVVTLTPKQATLNMLINSAIAKMFLSDRYTSKSWNRLISALKFAQSAAGAKNEAMLDKAIGMMQGSLAVLEPVDPNKEDKGTRDRLPANSKFSGANGPEAPAPTAAAASAAGAAAAINIST